MSNAKDEPTTQTPEPTEHDKPHAPDDIREQMRQALERKKNKGGGGGSGGSGGSGNKASEATTNAKVQREFRRKSGG
jgi:hypothetical protein